MNIIKTILIIFLLIPISSFAIEETEDIHSPMYIFTEGFVAGFGNASDMYKEYRMRCEDLVDEEESECISKIFTAHLDHAFKIYKQNMKEK